MEFLRSFFEINEPVIHFAYGLTFFAMGLAIALQSRSSSRLELARSLAWLAAFGMMHSLYQWGELFSPVHEAYLTPWGIEILHQVHLVFLSISFACLMEFGVTLLRPLEGRQWLNWITPILLGGYWVLMVFVLPRRLPNPHEWHNTAEALARYSMGFPGGLLAAYGLREQAYRVIRPLDAPHIVNTLRLAGIALALYALFGGLIPPSVPFFPGNTINTETFERALGMPPLVFQSLIGLGLAFTVIRALEVFDVETERRIEQIEQQQILSAERERIARELHDGTIQTVYSAGLLVDSARKLAEPGSQVAARLERAASVLNDAIGDLRRSLGELHSAPSSEPLAAALQHLAEDPRFRSLLNISQDIQLSGIESLSPARTEHILSIVNEALSNVARHAHARQAHLSAHAVDGQLILTIQDNGIGFTSARGAGYGLRNMNDRARLLGGHLEVNSGQGRGTTVLLTIPLHEDR